MSTVISEGFNLEQQEAIELALDDTTRKLFITGIGGSGKSHVIREITKHYKVEDLILLAPTHSAARLIGGQTIHSFFQVGMQLDTDAKSEQEALNCNLDGAELSVADGKVIIIDECSMLGGDMLEKIIRDMPVRKLILVGDPMQLNPVKDSAVDWEDFCDETVMLVENYRTSNPELLKAINHYRDHEDDDALFKAIKPVKFNGDLTLRSDTVCIAHKNHTLSMMQKDLLGYAGAKQGDEVLTFGSATEHMILIKDPRTGKDKLSPYYVNGDVMKITSGPQTYYADNLYSVRAVNVEYMNREPIDKNPKFPSKVELLIGDYDSYKRLLQSKYSDAQEFGNAMVKKYSPNARVKAKNLVHKFTPDERREWGQVWHQYLGFKSKAYARHKQFVTSYKIQGRSATDVIIHWDDLPSADHKYVALSRAIESVQILKLG